MEYLYFVILPIYPLHMRLEMYAFTKEEDAEAFVEKYQKCFDEQIFVTQLSAPLDTKQYKHIPDSDLHLYGSDDDQ